MQTKELADEEIRDNGRQAIRKWGICHKFLIGDGDDLYLWRLSLVTTPWFSVKLHRIFRPDRQRDLHDHPWTFLSIILLGSYTEETPEGVKTCRWWNWKRAEDSHSIKTTSRKPVWTLVFTGPRRRIWGFHTKDGWVQWDKYEKLEEA